MRVDAGRATCETESRACRFDQGVVLQRGAETVRAPEARVDPAEETIDASGGVLLTDPTRALSARVLRAFSGGRFLAEDVVAVFKASPQPLSSATTFDEARRHGRNRLVASGTRLEGEGDGRFTLQDARLTLCDCPGGGAPSWELQAPRADVMPGKRAILSWPVLRITPRFLFIDHPVPVLVLPWLYVPLSDRQSGLLIPQVVSGTATGFVLAQPVFLTLGRSADATVTPLYAFGPIHIGSGPSLSSAAVRGPGANTELRWAPAEAAAGRLEVRWLQDLDTEPGEMPARLAILGTHSQRLSPEATLRADLELFNDRLYVRDFSPDVLIGAATYTRSDALLSWRHGDAVVELGAAYHLLMLVNGAVPPVPFGTFGAKTQEFHRWPSLTADLAPIAWGPVLVSGRAGLGRYAPLSGEIGSQPLGLTAPYAPAFQVPPEQGFRVAVNRADARVELRAPLLLGRAVLVEPYVRGAALGYIWDTLLEPAANAWGIAGARLWSEFSRSFGAIRNAIAPSLEVRAGSAVLGPALQVPSYDAWDRAPTGFYPTPVGSASAVAPGRTLAAAPPGAFSQARLALETRLSRGSTDFLRLAVGQDADLRAGQFAETWAQAALAGGPASLNVLARFDPLHKRAEGYP